MAKLTVEFHGAQGFGKCVTADGTTVCVLKTREFYNLSIQHKGEFSFWAKENVKRISTLQKWLDERGYDVKIETA